MPDFIYLLIDSEGEDRQGGVSGEGGKMTSERSPSSKFASTPL